MTVSLGFETIGNATVTVFDNGTPVLTTDPWIDGEPYFGSWGHSNVIPRQQRENALNASYAWVSHGHPDHICAGSIENVNGRILVPDHVGARIENDLIGDGLNCQRLESNKWLRISENVRIISFADWNQDATLLIDIAGKDLLVNLNDGNAWGWSRTIKDIVKQYPNRFMLRLQNWGDADMCNIYDADGNFLPLQTDDPLGPAYERSMKAWNCNYAIPFSKFHRYQRTDSVHMNRFISPIEFDFREFNGPGDLLPPFISWDTETGTLTELSPPPVAEKLLTPEELGDSWTDELEAGDFDLIERYFRERTHLAKHFGALHFVVGGKRNTVRLGGNAAEIVFEVPRSSLVTAVQYEVFDDLLIGNFMKTTLLNVRSLYPDFSPYVTKYADNGQAKNRGELNDYFRQYRKRSPVNFLCDQLVQKSETTFRRFVAPGTKLYEAAKPLRGLLR